MQASNAPNSPTAKKSKRSTLAIYAVAALSLFIILITWAIVEDTNDQFISEGTLAAQRSSQDLKRRIAEHRGNPTPTALPANTVRITAKDHATIYAKDLPNYTYWYEENGDVSVSYNPYDTASSQPTFCNFSPNGNIKLAIYSSDQDEITPNRCATYQYVDQGEQDGFFHYTFRRIR